MRKRNKKEISKPTTLPEARAAFYRVVISWMDDQMEGDWEAAIADAPEEEQPLMREVARTAHALRAELEQRAKDAEAQP